MSKRDRKNPNNLTVAQIRAYILDLKNESETTVLAAGSTRMEYGFLGAMETIWEELFMSKSARRRRRVIAAAMEERLEQKWLC